MIEGVFDIADGVLKVLSAPDKTVEVLKRLERMLQEAKAAKDPDRAAEFLGDDPEWDDLRKLLPQNRTEGLAYIAILLAIVQCVLAYMALPAAQTPTVTPPTTAQIIQQITNINVPAVAVPAPPAKTPTPKPQFKAPNQEKRKIGRNELCPCGSGKKSKKCHFR